MIEEIDMATHRPRMRKVLALGDYGAGKTHFLGTFPKPIAVFSFDKGYDTIAMMPGVKVISVLEDTRQNPKAWDQFRRRWATFLRGEDYTWPDGRKERFKSIGLDSLTFLSEMCMNHYQYMGQNVDKKASYTQYQQVLENMTDVVNEAKRCVEYICATALLKLDKDELSGEVLSLPALIGSIRDTVGAQFDAVFYLYADKTPKGEEVFKLKTVGGYREKAKIRLPADIRGVVAPTLVNPNFEEILKLVSDKIESVYGDRPQPPAEATSAPAATDTPVTTAAPGLAKQAPAVQVASPTPSIGARPSVKPAGVPVTPGGVTATPVRITPRVR